MICAIRGRLHRDTERVLASFNNPPGAGNDISSLAHPIGQDGGGGIMTRRASDFATWVSACATEIEIGNWSAVTRPSGEGPPVEHLPRRHIEMPDVPISQGDPAIDVERCKERPVHNDVTEIRCVMGESVDEMLADLLPPCIPCSLAKIDRRVENPDRHHMVAPWSHCRVIDRGDLDLHHRGSRGPTVPRIIPTAFEVFDRGTDLDMGEAMRIEVSIKV